MGSALNLPFFLSIPHSGESVPKEVNWLQGINPLTLMRDVDRYVDKLYLPVIQENHIPAVLTEWHRYVVDLNRKPDEYDQSSVQGAPLAKGKHPKGLHWSVTTFNETLISMPMSPDLHDRILLDYYHPFHQAVRDLATEFLKKNPQIFHLDLHSMPSLGTKMHPDPGQYRADIVISDFHGKSTCREFKEIVLHAYQESGFQVAYNYPYVGGGITQIYGNPKSGHNTIQVELNRALYMNEATQNIRESTFNDVQSRLGKAVERIISDLRKFLHESG